VSRLLALLEQLGFAPDPPPARKRGRTPQIDLRSCPFLEVAASRPLVTCPVHLGMMQGALEAWGSPVTVDALEPFAEPDRCIARLGEGRA
jgi:predicted ArsR family transcriptional regulator